VLLHSSIKYILYSYDTDLDFQDLWLWHYCNTLIGLS